MTNLLIETPTSERELPPTPDQRRSSRHRTLALLLVFAALALGALLVAGALSWGGLGTETGTVEVAIDTGTESASSAVSAVAPAMTDVSEIAAEAVDAVVVVEVTFDSRGPFDATGSGSGVILTAEGTIVTNAHVVDDATSIVVELTDGSTHEATVLAVDTSKDIAILDIDATGLETIDLGSTADLAVGDPVIAVGNPLALEGGPSVSTGIVSALDRVLEDSDTTLTGIIQTDAAITEGSSGGALLDSNGDLIGITTAVGVSSVGVEGIAFAVPVETVVSVLETLSGV